MTAGLLISTRPPLIARLFWESMAAYRRSRAGHLRRHEAVDRHATYQRIVTTWRYLGLICLAVVLTACGGGVAATPEPTERPTPEPTPVPWALDVTDTSYTKQAGVGDNITIEVTIENTGKQRNPVTLLNFSELDQYADLFGCDPDCETDDPPGLGPSAFLPGIKPGKSATYTVEFIATTVGVVEWSVCVYGEDSYSSDSWCGNAKTAIR